VDISRPGVSKRHIKDYIDNCVCLNVRKASRAVTRLYDEALQKTGIRSTQLIILMVLEHLEKVTVSKLAEELVMDASTVARNLRPLHKQGLIQIIPGTDRRQRIVSLTAKGQERVEECLEHWNRAQNKIFSAFSEKEFENNLTAINNISDAVLKIHDPHLS